MNGLDILRAARTTGDHLAARDYLLQADYCEDRITSVLDSTPLAVRYASKVVLTDIEQCLNVENGRKRERTLMTSSVLCAIRDAVTSLRWGWRHGGHPTANSYGYAYSAVACGVVVDGDSVLIGIARTGGRVAPFGIGTMSDRATRPATIVRLHDDFVTVAREIYDISCSIAAAEYLTRKFH